MSDQIKQGCEPSECGTKPACAGCSHNHNQQPEEKKEPPKVRKVIGVVSGKGGVGKSLVSGELAVMLSRMGYRVGVLDADITGPSIPRMFGIHDKAMGDGEHIFPAETEKGIKVMSINLMLESDDAPVIWRGPVIAGAVKQFWEDVSWGELDVMVIDMPPGTGDVPLTVFQSLPVDGILIVTSPQELVSMIVGKAVNMAKKMDVPIIGLIENMSYLECPDCGKKISVFGESKVEEVGKEYGIPVLAQIPIRPEIAGSVDEGTVEYVKAEFLEKAAEAVEKL